MLMHLARNLIFIHKDFSPRVVLFLNLLMISDVCGNIYPISHNISAPLKNTFVRVKFEGAKSMKTRSTKKRFHLNIWLLPRIDRIFFILETMTSKCTQIIPVWRRHVAFRRKLYEASQNKRIEHTKKRVPVVVALYYHTENKIK